MRGSMLTEFKTWAERTFPERYLYLRTGDDTKAYVLSTRKQMALATLAGILGVWTALSTGAVALVALTDSASEAQMNLQKAQSERWIADRQARLDTAVARLNETSGSVDNLAVMIERRHAALSQVVGEFKDIPGAQAALKPVPINPNAPAIERIYAVRSDQERMIARSETFAKSRAERLRLAFRLAGLNPGSSGAGATGLGGPLVDAKDPKALAEILDVDEGFAARIHSAVSHLSDMRSMQDRAERLPFARPAHAVRTTSGFGVRFDPFTRRPATHNGLDFAGPYMTPIKATAPGTVAFAGIRGGYGKTVEIDHGSGFKTRYAHLQAISVRAGQRVAVGQRVGAMGSTGRSTGVHLHYEVWMNGRPQNPARFVKAGDYVQQN